MVVEKTFQLFHGGMTTPCKLSQPDYGNVCRVVLGVHGFGGSSDDAIQAGIAEEMGLFRAATLRFDFPCHGANRGKEITLSACVETLLAVAAHAKTLYPEVEDLCIFASGFGAFVTLNALEALRELPGKVKLVVQTPAVCMDETILAMIKLTKETLWAMERFTVPKDPCFDVTYGFYEELRDHVVVKNYGVPMLILQGESDAYIHMDDIQYFHAINAQSKLVIIPGASHRFLEPGAWDMVLDLTRDWFEFEQVLLSDWE